MSKVERGERKANKEQILKLVGIFGPNKNELLIHFLSEKIACELMDEDVVSKTWKVAEERIKYYNLHKQNAKEI